LGREPVRRKLVEGELGDAHYVAMAQDFAILRRKPVNEVSVPESL